MSIETRSEDAVQPRVLIADDQPDVIEALRLLLKGHGYRTESATSPAGILDAVENREFDLVLMDLNYARDTTSGREGLDLLAQLRVLQNTPPIVVMTGWATVNLAVEAMQHGVGDFVEKPWTNARLLEILHRQFELGRERRKARERADDETRRQNKVRLQLHAQEHELQQAREIQKGFLPGEIPQLAGYDIAGVWQPARVVGGDYFDVIPFQQDALALCIADVAGKGLPAAMLMSNLQAAVRGLASPGVSPEELCSRLNAFVYRNIGSDRFITLFYAEISGAARTIRYVNAGHNAPILLHRDGSHERLSEGGGVLGVFPMLSYSAGMRRLSSGDRVVMFTDGVTEASAESGEEFGEERLLQVLHRNRDAGAAGLEKSILSAAGDFCGNNWQDDATLVILAVGQSED